MSDLPLKTSVPHLLFVTQKQKQEKGYATPYRYILHNYKLLLVVTVMDLFNKCHAATYHCRDICSQMAKISDLGNPLGAPAPQKGRRCVHDRYVPLYSVQNFTLIGATVAEISVIYLTFFNLRRPATAATA